MDKTISTCMDTTFPCQFRKGTKCGKIRLCPYQNNEVKKEKIMGKNFCLGDVLSVTSGILLSPRLMEGVYDILNYMTGESLFTHQLPRASEFCKPALLKQFPNLRNADIEGINSDNYQEHLSQLIDKFGNTFDIEPLPKGAYIYIDPITEAEAIAGPEKVIIVKE